MIEQNIRDAFECDKYYGRLDKLTGKDGVYISSFTMTAYAAFKAGWIAAFKVILEGENE